MAKAKDRTTDDANDIVELSYQQQVKRFQVADEILAACDASQVKPTVEEQAFFLRLGWDEKEVGRQLRRVHHVQQQKAIAGSSQDRENAAARRDSTANDLKEKGPLLERQIEALQSQLHKLERDAELSAKRCEQMVAAVNALRTLAPQHVSKRFEQEKVIYKQTMRRHLQDLELRHREVCCLLDMEAGRHSDMLAHEVSELIRRNKERRSQCKLSDDELKAELEHLQVELPKVQAECDQAEAEINAILDHYV